MVSLWFLLWFWLNVVVTLLNKTFFATLKAPYPGSITLVHMAMSGALAGATLVGFPRRYASQAIPVDMQKKLCAMSLLFIANIVVGNASLSYCSISFVQMMRCTIPFVTAVLSKLVLGTSLRRREWMALAPIVLGAAIVSYGEVHLTLLGLFLTVLGCVLSALKTVLTKLFLSGEGQLPPLVLLRHVSLLGALMLVPLTRVSEPAFLDAWVPAQSGYVMFLLLLHGAMAFLLNVANFEANKSTSPLLITIGGNVKSVVTVFLSIVLFSVQLTFTGVLGAAITFAGVFWYNYEQLAGRRAPAAKGAQPGKGPGTASLSAAERGDGSAGGLGGLGAATARRDSAFVMLPGSGGRVKPGGTRD